VYSKSVIYNFERHKILDYLITQNLHISIYWKF